MLRSSVLVSVCVALCFAFGTSSAGANPQRARSAERQYAGALSPVFTEMVTAAGKVVAGFDELAKPNFPNAEARFDRGLSLYRRARAKVDSIRPPAAMVSTARYLRAALADYVQAVTLYHRGAERQTMAVVSKGLPSYSRANRETDLAVASMRAVLSKENV